MDKVVNIKSIFELQRLGGMEPLHHPLIMVVRLEEIPKLPDEYPTSMCYDFYSIGLKRNLNGYVKYGREKYDFQEGIMGFSAPGQLISYDRDVTFGSSGWILFFHREILFGHPLSELIHNYGFFDYDVNEALHLSKSEEMLMEQIFENINSEYNQQFDTYSKSVVLSNIELLLTYTNRFYGRQFITRNDASSSLIYRFQREIKNRFERKYLLDSGLPTVALLADALHVSPNYLSDALKTLTGKSTQEHIHFQLIQKAKQNLLATNKSIAEIAFELGFEYPQYFSRLFKEKTGMTPTDYRK